MLGSILHIGTYFPDKNPCKGTKKKLLKQAFAGQKVF